MERFLSGGGSGAVTYQSQVEGRPCVTKVVPLEKSAALREQCGWLRERPHPMFVAVLSEREDGQAYAIDLAFEKDSLDSFDYVHTCTADERVAMLESVVELLSAQVWGPAASFAALRPTDARDRLEAYISKHVEGSLAQAREAMPSLGALIDAETVVVNGEGCPNVGEILRRIRSSDVVMDDLCSFRTSRAVHGDLILDNILWSGLRGHAVVIDPVPFGNYLDGPVFDFGKLCQSLWIGYEFMLRDTSDVAIEEVGHACVSVTYADKRSAAYEQMWRHVCDVMAARMLTPSERRTMLFVGATNFLRRMKHQALQCPANAPAFYAAGLPHLKRYLILFGEGSLS